MSNPVRKMFVVLGATIFFAYPAFSQAVETEDERGFFFQLGLGLAAVEYPGEYDDLIETLAEASGVTRTRLNLHLGFGHLVTRNVYVILLLDATGDRLDDGVNYLQTNTYFFNGGIRYYPFGTGLVLGIHGGPARVVMNTDFVGSEVSDFGFGGGGMFGYDFDPSPTGFSGMVGVRLNAASIESETTATAALFLSLLWK